MISSAVAYVIRENWLIPPLLETNQDNLNNDIKQMMTPFNSCHGFGWIISFTSRVWLTATSHRFTVIVMQLQPALANPVVRPAQPAALFMSTNKEPSSGVLATLPVTSLPWPGPACLPTALARVYANACSLGLTMLGQRLLPELGLGAFLTWSNQHRHPPNGVQRTVTC